MSSTRVPFRGRLRLFRHLCPDEESNLIHRASARLANGRLFALGIHPRRGHWGQTHKTILLRAWKKLPALRRCPRYVCAAGRRRVYAYDYVISQLPRGRRCALVFLCRVRGSNPHRPRVSPAPEAINSQRKWRAAPGLLFRPRFTAQAEKGYIKLVISIGKSIQVPYGTCRQLLVIVVWLFSCQPAADDSYAGHEYSH